MAFEPSGSFQNRLLSRHHGRDSRGDFQCQCRRHFHANFGVRAQATVPMSMSSRVLSDPSTRDYTVNVQQNSDWMSPAFINGTQAQSVV